MPAVLDQPRQTKLIPGNGESQIAFVARADKALYRKIPDRLKRSRYILRCWRESGRDGNLARITADRFPEGEFQTIHDSPIFAEHSTVGSDGQRRVYDRNALAQIVESCNRRILDTGDYAVLSAGHTPEEHQMTAGMPMPDVLGYCGPFRLGMIGNLKPRWAIFADEHYHRSEIVRLQRLPRRSPEVWLEDNILDPIAALGAETPRLDTGIIRNCRLPNGRTIHKYSAATFPGGVNTSAPSFGKKKSRSVYAAGDSNMATPNTGDDTAVLDAMPDEHLQAIIQGVANALMQSKPMQFVMSQMPPDWTPNAPEDDQIPGEEAAEEPGMDEELPADDASLGEEATLEPDGDELAPDTEAAGAPPMDGGEPPNDVGAATAANYPDDEATPDEASQMDDEERENYAAHDSAGRKGFLWAWRHGRKHKAHYSAGTKEPCMPAAPAARKGGTDAYSRLAAENAAQKARIDQLEARNRHAERYSKLNELHQTHAFDLDAEVDETKDLPQGQFDRHCTRIAERYARLPVARGQFSAPFPVEQPEVLVSDKQAQAKQERYSRRAKEIADAALKADPKRGLSWDEAMAKAVSEDTAAAK